MVRRNDWGFVWDRGLVEGEKDGPEEGHRLVAGIWLKLRMDIYNEGGADGGEQARLCDQVSW